jgi:A/G-specific adenine glycosylase
VRTKKIDRDQAVLSVRPAEPDPRLLLAWYDRHRRVLPWRAAPGKRADPYRVWLAEIMLQQTTVKTVGPYYARFLARWPTLEALAKAPLDEVLKTWAGLGYYARARNLHACARTVLDCHAGRFPATERELLTLPGIGLYTAAAIAAIAFDARTTPVDGNIERVVARLFAVAHELPAAKPRIRELAAQMTPKLRTGDFAQALMDLGATICTPKRPACTACPWVNACAARRRGDPEAFPAKAAKPKGRLRRGAAFVVAREDDAVLVRTRPASGLLGGMTEVPTTPWTHEFDDGSALDQAPSLGVPRRKRPIKWRPVAGAVTHVFTHFPLELIVYTAQVPLDTTAPGGMRFVPASDLAGEALPNLMRKVLAHASKL